MSEQIKVLSEIDKVRKRINIWYGDNGYNAILHTIKETVGNSVDEINKGNGNNIYISVSENRKVITIKDDCKGLPVEGVDSVTGKENYKLICEQLFAGTKYDNGLNGNNDYTIGCNGVHLTVLTRASKNITYEISRSNKKVYSFSYCQGELSKPIQVIGTSEETYTKITYELDDEVFTTTTFNIDDIYKIAEEQSSLINGTIYITDETDNTIKLYHLENGILELLGNRIENKNTINETIILNKEVTHHIEKDNINDDIKINLCMVYTHEDDNNNQIEFLNGSNLIHHGTIQDGLFQGLRNSFNKFAKQEGLYAKNEKQLSKDDIVSGLNYIVNFKSYFPVFANQTKFASYVDYYKDIMQKTIEDYFEVYSIENKQSMLKITNHILVCKRANEKAENSRKDIKKKLEQEVGATSRPDKFVPCRTKDKYKRELILIEGDSSLNSVKLSRNSDFQCIYALKGKPINALKQSIDRLLKNQEIQDIFQILNCGMEYNGKSIKGLKKFDINDLEMSKIVIFTDEDDDGLHIRSLLICIFYVLARKIVENGHLYILDSPLYRIDTKSQTHLAYNDKEKNDIVRDLNNQNIKFVESRFKGLGGLSVDLLSETAMHIENRKLTQITMMDIEKAKEILEMFLDEDSTDRKEYIEQNGVDYFDFSIYEI